MREEKGVLSGMDGIPELALSPCAAPHPTRGRITSMVKAPDGGTDSDFGRDPAQAAGGPARAISRDPETTHVLQNPAAKADEFPPPACFVSVAPDGTRSYSVSSRDMLRLLHVSIHIL